MRLKAIPLGAEKGSLLIFRLAGSPNAPHRAGDVEAAGGLVGPILFTIRRPTPHALAKPLQGDIVHRLVHQRVPLPRLVHRPPSQRQGIVGIACSKTGPPPLLRPLHQPRPQRIGLHIPADGEEMPIVLS